MMKQMPFSRIRGRLRVGEQFLYQEKLVDPTINYNGLVDNMKDYSSPDFDAEKLSPAIIDFYENTNEYNLTAKINWAVWFKPAAFIYSFISKYIQQLHLSTGSKRENMHGQIIGVKTSYDGRERVRAWLRKNEKDEAIFVALYAQHISHGETYMNIALPLPLSNMTGILRPQNDGNNLILTSVRRKSRPGDEGIYLNTALTAFRLPLKELFYIKTVGSGQLTAFHQMWLFGIKFLSLDYQINRKAPAK